MTAMSEGSESPPPSPRRKHYDWEKEAATSNRPRISIITTNSAAPTSILDKAKGFFSNQREDSESDAADRVSSTGSSRVLKSEMDEKVKMDEKRKAFALTGTLQDIYEITGRDPRRLRMDAMMEHGFYQTVMTVCTFLSMVLVAMDADYHAKGEARTDVMDVADALLIAVFALDIIAKLYVYQSRFPRYVMNVFEAALLLIDIVVQFWPKLPRIAGALKVLRFVRMMRILRSLSSLRELYLMMMGIAASIRAIVFGAALLFFATTVFSILAVYFVAPVAHTLDDAGEFGDCDDCRRSFDRVASGNLVFFKTVMAGDSWGQLAVPICRANWVAGAILIGAWSVLWLGLMNTIAAVIVDRQAQARVQDADYMATLQAEDLECSMTRLLTMFKEFDADGDDHTMDSVLTEEKLLLYYDENISFRSLLNRLDVHRPHVPVLFSMFDTDGNRDLTFAEFVHGLHNLKNENSHTVAIFTKHYCETLLEKAEDIEVVKQVLQRQDRRLSALCNTVEVAFGRHRERRHDPDSVREKTLPGSGGIGESSPSPATSPERSPVVSFKIPPLPKAEQPSAMSEHLRAAGAAIASLEGSIRSLVSDLHSEPPQLDEEIRSHLKAASHSLSKLEEVHAQSLAALRELQDHHTAPSMEKVSETTGPTTSLVLELPDAACRARGESLDSALGKSLNSGQADPSWIHLDVFYEEGALYDDLCANENCTEASTGDIPPQRRRMPLRSPRKQRC
eukprot:TRINITY_DN11216_c0_g5_i1.p1 TRINITY_DN11216_c0_g5~~TRINITY_DN11216_c0_g5_i1.p1  ORF type:complete len:735 (-),score=136.73 TRINITY_DN11216_c0_g5_i1:137-2341(-)